MKKILFNQYRYLSAVCTLASLLWLGVSVSHSQDGPPGGRRGGPRDMLRMLPVMVALDADGDGTLSTAEINNASAALRKLDKNGDGQLTEDELRPNFPGGPGGRGPGDPGAASGPSADEIVKQLLEFDQNSDGQLAKSEVPERMHGLFERGDANHDGVLSKDELRKLAEAQSNAARPGERDEPRENERRPQRPPNQ